MNQPTVEIFTCIAIIIAMGVVVFKPFNGKRINYLSEKIDKLVMKQESLSQGLYYNEDNFKKLKSEIEKLKSEKKHSLKNQKKTEKRNEK